MRLLYYKDDNDFIPHMCGVLDLKQNNPIGHNPVGNILLQSFINVFHGSG